MRDLLVFGYRDRPQRASPLLRTMVGDVLRRTRLEQHRTLADVASSARISMQYLSELERGRKEASSEILAALCGALRLDLSELLAAVGRDLLDQRARRSRLVRIDGYRDGDQRPRTAAPALDAPSEPADSSATVSSATVSSATVGPATVGPATVSPATVSAAAVGPAAVGLAAVGPAADCLVGPPARGSGDAVCRLAA
ncbi:MAG: helix-turn-helix domain-containing protein [Streptosporangiaceae bacterium]